MSGTVIKKCSCSHEYQDKRYGTGMRVHNVGKKPPTGSAFVKCTVCGSKK